MNPNTPPPSDDDLPDERELAALYARLPKIEPDAALDAAVLARATQATPVRRRPRWPVALSSAAVLVLAVGVAWQVRETQPSLASAPLPTPAATTADAPLANQEKSVAAPAPPAPLERKVETAAKRAPKHARPAPAPAPVILQEYAPAIAPAPAEPPAPSSPPTASIPPEPPPASAPIAAQAVIPLSRLPAPSAGVSDAVRSYAPAAQEGLDTPPAPAKVLRQRALEPGPDDRVGDIRRLLGRGEREEALHQLDELRRRYPHYDLPQDLRDLKP